MLFQIFLTATIVPKSQDLARSFLRTSSINYLENFVKPRIFNDAVKGLTIYTNSKDDFGNLKEIVEQYWQCLQSEHLISLAGFQIDAGSLEQEMHIINRYEPKSY